MNTTTQTPLLTTYHLPQNCVAVVRRDSEGVLITITQRGTLLATGEWAAWLSSDGIRAAVLDAAAWVDGKCETPGRDWTVAA